MWTLDGQKRKWFSSTDAIQQSAIRQRLEKTERVGLAKAVLSKGTRRHLAGKAGRPHLSVAACTEGSSELALAGSASGPGWHIEGSSEGGKKTAFKVSPLFFQKHRVQAEACRKRIQTCFLL